MRGSTVHPAALPLLFCLSLALAFPAFAQRDAPLTEVASLPHATVYATPGISLTDRSVSEARSALLDAQSRIASRLGLAGGLPDVTVLLLDEESYRETVPGNAQALFAHHVAVTLRSRSGPVEHRGPAVVLRPLRPGEDYRQTVLHEHTHAVVHAIAGEAAPPWLSEGLAEYVSLTNTQVADRVRRHRHDMEHSERRLQIVPPTALTPADFSLMPYDHTYRTSVVFVEHLSRRGGSGAMLRFLRALGDGSSPDQAARLHFRQDLAGLERSLLGFSGVAPPESLGVRGDVERLDDPPRRISVGQSVSERLTRQDNRLASGHWIDFYEFAGREGDEIFIVAESDDYLPHLFVVLPGGFRLEGHARTDEIASVLSLQLPESGDYRVGVTSRSPGVTGRYVFDVTEAYAVRVPDRRTGRRVTD